jgi:hypothetical protein
VITGPGSVRGRRWLRDQLCSRLQGQGRHDMPNKKNELFARLNLADFQQVERHVRTVELQQGSILAHTHQPIQNVYFPHSGIISCIVETKSGDAIETGMIGKDGVRRWSGVRSHNFVHGRNTGPR